MFKLSDCLITGCSSGYLGVTERVAICHYLSLSVRDCVLGNGGAILENTNAFRENGVRIFLKTASVWREINSVFDERLTDNDG